MTWDVVVGDCRESLRAMPAGSVQTCVTSPPYFGLRDYGTGEWEGGDLACDHIAGMARQDTQRETPGGRGGSFRGGTVQFRDVCGRCSATRVDRQIGLEPTPDEFVQALVAVFREVRRVLRDDGTVWLNLGDSFCSTDKWGGGKGGNTGKHTTNGEDVPSWAVRARKPPMPGIKPKDLLGIPWMVAFALRADGWYLRSDIIWAKPNPMPESVTDRPTKAHEYLFLLSKGPRYFYDTDAIREAPAPATIADVRIPFSRPSNGNEGSVEVGHPLPTNEAGRNKRSVWTVATQPFPGAHFATFPPKLIEPCVLAGSSPKACGLCGAPWERVVERTAMVVQPSERRNGWQEEQPGLTRTQTGGTMVEPPTSRTVGWEPSCEHDDDLGACIVLDPFAGSGTVGVVCGWHGRDFIGCELNPAYAEMARERIALEGRPGGRPAHHEPVRVIGDQLGLLDGVG